MSEHIMTTRLTAEDFKNAMFAVLPKYGLRAHRSAGNSYWQRDGINRATNAEMAAAGWRPVHEHNPHATDALEEEIQDLRDRLNAVGLDIPKSAVRMLHERGVRATAVTSDECYTPDEEEVRDIYESRVPHSMVDPGGEFDRFLAKIKAEAWDECARSAGDMASPLMDQNPYRRDEA